MEIPMSQNITIMMRRLLRLAAIGRLHIRSIVATIAFAIVIIELGGIWNEVHHMRGEQVKNALYSFPAGRRAALPATTQRHLENTVNVNGSVEIDGEVKLEEPVEVEIDH